MLVLMKNSKNALIANTSISSLNQILSNVIKESFQGCVIVNNNNTNEECSSPERKSQISNPSSPAVRNENGIKMVTTNITAQEEKIRLLAQVLYDFVVIADDQKCQWWPKSIPPDKELGEFQLIQFI